MKGSDFDISKFPTDMLINFTKEQYEKLMQLVYLGELVVNYRREGTETDPIMREHRDLAAHIFSHARDFGLGHHVEYDEIERVHYPTHEFAHHSEVNTFRLDYNDQVFWDELAARMVERDLERELGRTAFALMDEQERLDREEPAYRRYEQEFDQFGIERIKIDEEN